MDINEIPRGQLSTIILTTLLDADKYGLEIIDEIEKKTFGEVVIKKPSLYSSLNRMEKQDLVSSYWKDSDIGGRRHYYRLTDFGRKQVLQWQNELLSSQTKVSKILSQADEESKEESVEETKQTILQQENLFDYTKPSSPIALTNQKQSETISSSRTQDYLQYDLFSQTNFVYPDTKEPAKQQIGLNEEPTVFNFKEMEKAKLENEKPIVVKKEIEDKEKSMPIIKEVKKEVNNNEQKPFPQTQKKIVPLKTNFNFESEYEKYNKTFSSYAQTIENNSKANNEQIYSPFNAEKSEIITDINRSIFDESDLPEKLEVTENTGILNGINELHEQKTEVQKTNEKHDDAVLITVKSAEEFLPKVKKIAPAIFNVKPTVQKQQTNQFEAEKAYIESENIIKQKEEKTLIQTEKLKEYFNAKNIAFTPYTKKLQFPLDEKQNETKSEYIKINKFNMFKSLFMFALLMCESTVLFLILNHFGLFNITSSLWILIAFNSLLLIWFVYNFIVFLKDKHKTLLKKSIVQNPLWYKLVFVVIGLILVYALHLLVGLNEYNYLSYLTTLILPVVLLFDYLTLHFINLFSVRIK